MRSRRQVSKKEKKGGLKKGVVKRSTKKGLRVRRRSVKRMRRGGDIEMALSHLLTFFIVGCAESAALVAYLNHLSPRILEIIKLIVGFGGDVMMATAQFSLACSIYALQLTGAAATVVGSSASLWLFTVALTVDSTVLLWKGDGLVATWERRWGRCSGLLTDAGRNIGRYLIFGAMATGRICTSLYGRINGNRDIRALCCTQAAVYGTLHTAVLASMRRLDTLNHEGMVESVDEINRTFPILNPSLPPAAAAAAFADTSRDAAAAVASLPAPQPPEDEEGCTPAYASGGGFLGGAPIDIDRECEFVNTTIAGLLPPDLVPAEIEVQKSIQTRRNSELEKLTSNLGEYWATPSTRRAPRAAMSDS
jgi:hypothetical protein